VTDLLGADMNNLTASKTCSKCQADEPLADFNKQAKSKDGYHYYCRECQRGYARSNKERYAEYSRRWHAANADHKADLQRQWVAQNSLTKAEWQVAWKRANSERVREYHSRRRALIAGSSAEVVDLAAVWERSADECYICGVVVAADLQHPDPMSKSIDHVIPLSRGGAHVDENLAYVHLICNQRKNAKLLSL
jgi:5-methylcytosine-specific restriction endonuclease McrA